MPLDVEREPRTAQLALDAEIHAKLWDGHSPGRVLSQEEVEAIRGEITPVEEIPHKRETLLYFNY